MIDCWELFKRIQDSINAFPEGTHELELWGDYNNLNEGEAEIRLNGHLVGYIKLELLFQSIDVYIYDREWNKFVDRQYWEFQDGCDDDEGLRCNRNCLVCHDDDDDDDDDELDCDHDCFDCDVDYIITANNIVNIRKDIMRFLYNALIKYDVQKTLFGRDYETDEAST